ncbi:MAG TPA: metalloregulator ArsR/SmtB family transcription factor [Clostridia bacterium]|nr:metalloregulator ArsR/SmtB family transcription factor [Clostridia bacterium]
MELLLDNAEQELVKQYVPRNATLHQLSNLFSAFSDATRTKIICALSITEICVGDLAHLLGLNQTTCSHQLRLLKALDVVEDRRDGKVVYYRLKNESVAKVLMAGVEFLGY